MMKVNPTRQTITSEVILEIKKRPKWKNFKKWLKVHLCGTLSLFTCCICAGCCGTLKPPNVMLDEDMKDEYNKMHPTDKKIINVSQWCGLTLLTISSPFSCCSCCCGCCGVISPSEYIEVLKK